MAPRKKTKPTDEIIRLGNVFVVSGVRDLVDREVSSLVEKFVGKPKSGSKIEFQGKDSSMDQIFEAFSSKNLFVPKRVIILYSPTVDQRKFIVDNLVRLSGFKASFLIIVVPELTKEEKKQVFWGTFIEFGNFIECMPAIDQYGRPNQEQVSKIRDWLLGELTNRKLRMSDRAVATMLMLCNYKMGLIQAEVNKLAYYFRNTDGNVPDSDLVQIVGSNIEASVFTFRDQLEAGRVIDSLKTLAILMNSDSFSPDEFIRMLQNRLKDIAIIRSYVKSGFRDENSIADAWKRDVETYKGKSVVPHPYVIKMALNSPLDLTPEKASELIRQLGIAEVSLRGYDNNGAKHPPYLLLTDFVLNYCKMIDSPTFV
jgi:DNA polymerase III delta subunit